MDELEVNHMGFLFGVFCQKYKGEMKGIFAYLAIYISRLGKLSESLRQRSLI